MSVPMLALLIGLFIVPVALLWMGHRLRRRTPAWRGAFWGAVTGHALGMLVTVAALHYPPVLWGGGTRTVLVHWAMLLGAVLGGAVGWMMGARRAGAAGTAGPRPGPTPSATRSE